MSDEYGDICADLRARITVAAHEARKRLGVDEWQPRRLPPRPVRPDVVERIPGLDEIDHPWRDRWLRT